MKKGKFLFAITGTIILLLQSILPAVAIDESEDLKNIKAELESMIPEEELGKYGKKIWSDDQGKTGKACRI